MFMDDLLWFQELFFEEYGVYYIIFLDDIICYNFFVFLDEFILGVYVIKVFWDVEFYIDDEYFGDLVEKICESFDEWNIGLFMCFFYDSCMLEEFFVLFKE